MPEVFGGEVETLPEPPILLPDVHNVEDDGTGDHVFTNPYLPPMTTTRDGRIGLMRKRFNALNRDARFHLFIPEGVSEDFMASSTNGAFILGPKADILSSNFDNESDSGNASTESGQRATHFAICDPVDQNPTVCASDPSRDCYDFHVVTAVKMPETNPDRIDIWRASVHVEVTNPKTDQAAIDSASLSVTNPVAGASLTLPFGGTPEFHTPMIVGDNRLLITRIGPAAKISWEDNNSVSRDGRYDTVYAHYPESEGGECDVTKWIDFKPIVYSTVDTDLEDSGNNKLYDFTEYKFRSAQGVELNTDPALADIPDLGARYIWMDFGAKNLFFGTTGRKLVDETTLCTADPANACHHLYDLKCLDDASPSCSAYDGAIETQASFYNYAYDPASPSEPEKLQTPPHMMWSFAGLWSHGKMVMLDTMFNNVDFAIEANEDNHRLATLFSGLDGDVRIGTGRTASILGGSWDKPKGWPATTVVFGSPENLFNHVPEMRPRSPFDVVWLGTGGARTDEIVFDDYLSRQTLIFSPMNAVFEVSENMTPTFAIAVHPYYDGNETNTNYDDMRLQNAATTTRWATPAYGEVVASSATTGRIENVALGGVKGRGFFLYEGSRIEYDIPEQPAGSDPNGQDWVVSLFLDPNFAEISGALRRLLTFEGGGYIDIHGFGKIKACAPGAGLCPSVTLPKYLNPNTRMWTHLAFHIDKANSKMRYFQDGFLFAETALHTGMELFGAGASTAGTLTVGTPAGVSKGVQGWIDELRVVEGPLDYELMCNHAQGTMLAVPPSYACTAPDLDCQTGTPLDTLLSRFSQHAANTSDTTRIDGRLKIHEALHGNSSIPSDSDYYLCHVDYGADLGISVWDSGDAAARSIRRTLQFPEGPVVAGELRPDSTANNFCLSCHNDLEKAGLTEAALALDTLCDDPDNSLTQVHCIMDIDARRQPSQAPRMMLGHVPGGTGGVFGDDKPVEDLDDQRTDPYLHDGPLYHWSFDEGSGTTVANQMMGDPEATSTDGTRTGADFQTSSTRRTPYLEFDAGLDGSNDDVDHVAIDEAIVIDDSQISLTAWFRLGGVSGVNDKPEETCLPFTGGKEPCTIIAKAKIGEDWLIRIANIGTTSSPTWRFYFVIKLDGVPKVLKYDTSSLTLSSWHHLAATYDGDEMKLYLDGGTAPEENLPVGAGSLSSGTNDVLIGARRHFNGTDAINPFYGLLDDVRIYNRALLGREVDALFDQTP